MLAEAQKHLTDAKKQLKSCEEQVSKTMKESEASLSELNQAKDELKAVGMKPCVFGLLYANRFDLDSSANHRHATSLGGLHAKTARNGSQV